MFNYIKRYCSLINIIVFFLLFIFVLNLRTVFFSFPIFYILAPIGLLFFLKDLYVSNFKLDKRVIKFFSLLILSFLVFSISFMFNQVGDFFYIRQVYVYSLISFFYVYFLIKIFLLDNENSFDKLVLMFVLVVFIQLFVSLILFLNGGLFDVFFSIFDTAIGYTDDDVIEQFNEQRMIAIGNPFFGSAIINCFTLVLLSVQFKYSKYRKISILLWLFISVLGVASARTTIFGVVLSFLILLGGFRVNYKYLLSIFVFLIFAFNFIYFTNERIKTIVDFSFNFIFDFKNSQASDSMNELLAMWSVIPNKLSTWLIGDNYFLDANGHYYQGVDIGYLRIIFSNGILGLFVYILIHMYLLFNVAFKKYMWSGFVYLLMVLIFLNFKGVANLIPLILIFFMYSIFYSKYSRVVNEL